MTPPSAGRYPGQRAELVTALIKSLPKQIRKNFVPAPDVARQATAALEADFDPATDELEPSLELSCCAVPRPRHSTGLLELGSRAPTPARELQGSGQQGQGSGRGQGPSALQEKLAPATRRAIAESLGATPATTHAPRRHEEALRTAGYPRRRARPAPGPAADGVVSERPGITAWDFGTVERQVTRTVKGHDVTGFPALVDEGKSVALRVFQTRQEQEAAMRGGVIRLLALRIPAPDRYVLEHLSNTEKLTFSQNPHGSVSALIADCAWPPSTSSLRPGPPLGQSGFRCPVRSWSGRN